MSTKKYYCEQWKLSPLQSPETQYKVRSLIESTKKFEDILDALELPVTDINLSASDDGVYLTIVCDANDYRLYVSEAEVISAYLKKHLPMKKYHEIDHRNFSPTREQSYVDMEYQLDLYTYEFPYPSHDYFYLSLYY